LRALARAGDGVHEFRDPVRVPVRFVQGLPEEQTGQGFLAHPDRLGELSQLLGPIRVQGQVEAADLTVGHADHGARMGTPVSAVVSWGEEAAASSPLTLCDLLEAAADLPRDFGAASSGGEVPDQAYRHPGQEYVRQPEEDATQFGERPAGNVLRQPV